MANESLASKVIVITGASSGFGRGAALRFAQAGASVALGARRKEVIQELARECNAAGGHAVAVQTDVTSQADVQQLGETALARFGRIDVWVNNAGSGALGRFEEVPLNEHVQVIETDLLGTVYGSYFAMQQFRQQGEGVLINVSSVIGKVPSPYFASYAAAKHGVVGLSACLRQELEEDKIEGIRVCTVMPTSMDTPFFEHAAQHTGHEAKPIPPSYDADKVVDLIVKLATDPEDEVSVGAAGKLFTFLHQLAPGLVEAMMAKQTRKAEFDKSPDQRETSGSVERPMSSGTAVGGGLGKTHG
jgi:NAD(P)-dependent dehydrogenase (short-subunit alcohol dehydrogenase family)